VDLGIVMVRNWWISLYLAWIAITLPVYLVIVLATTWISSFSKAQWMLLVFWLLKPLWERSQLHILSRAVFGEMPTLKQTLEAFPKLFVQQILMSITIRRFSPFRSFDLPVIQLEGLKSKERRRRLNTLHSGNNSGIVWTMFTCIHIETLLLFSGIAFIWMFIPEEVQFNPLVFLTTHNTAFDILLLIFGYLSTTLIAPIYVACGFSSYLNRRTILEGWDLELVFRNLQHVHQHRRKAKGVLPKSAGIASVSLIFLLQMSVFQGLFIPELFADEKTQHSQVEFEQMDRRHLAKERIQAVKAGPDFHTYETERSVRFRYDWFEDEEESTSNWPAWLKLLARFLGASIEYILWGALIAVLVILVLAYRHEIMKIKQVGLSDFIKQRKHHVKTTQELLSPDEKDLNAIPEKALILWKNGEQRQALGLLYRSSLYVLIHQRSLVLQDSLTEEECMRAVDAGQPTSISQFFRTLTRHWQQVAYGHRALDVAIFESITLQWSQLFIPDEIR
jgi:hypothetical protein